MTSNNPTGYLTLARFTGDPDRLLDSYVEASGVMACVGRDHGLILHAAAKTDEGVLIANLWPSRDCSEAASRDPRRLGQMKRLGLTPGQIHRQHYDVVSYTLRSG